MLCLSAGVCTIETIQEYHIDSIVNELSNFLKFIRESTSNYSVNEYKIHRNNSITLIYLVCRLLMFKEDGVQPLDSNRISSFRKELEEQRQQYDPDLYASDDNDTAKLSQSDYSSSSSKASLYTTAQTCSANEASSLWKTELETALLDYPLKHFYPDVHKIIFEALKVRK